MGAGSEIFSYCSYDPHTLLVGHTNFMIGINMYQDGLFIELKRLRITPPYNLSQVARIHKINDHRLLLLVGKPKTSIRVIDIDPVRWCQLDCLKLSAFSGEILDM